MRKKLLPLLPLGAALSVLLATITLVACSSIWERFEPLSETPTPTAAPAAVATPTATERPLACAGQARTWSEVEIMALYKKTFLLARAAGGIPEMLISSTYQEYHLTHLQASFLVLK